LLKCRGRRRKRPSPWIRAHLRPQSSDRNMQPSFAPTIAYTRFESAPETVIPILRKIPSGSPFPSKRFQVTPLSSERYKPLPAPPLEKNHGCRRDCQSAAKTMFGLCGSNTTSIPPVFSSLLKTFVHVWPPSAVRKIPRSWFGPNACPNAATRTTSAFLGSTIKAPVCRPSFKPTFFQVLPASIDL